MSQGTAEPQEKDKSIKRSSRQGKVLRVQWLCGITVEPGCVLWKFLLCKNRICFLPMLDSVGSRPSSQVENARESLREPPKQPLLPPKRPLSTSVSTGQDKNEGKKVETKPTVTRLPSSTPNPAPRTIHPPPAPKQPPVPPPKPQNRNSNPLMGKKGILSISIPLHYCFVSLIILIDFKHIHIR